MNESKHTPGTWVNGCGDGITGPTTPTGHPTCGEAVEWHEYCDRPKSMEFPKTQHTVVSHNIETIAIIPLNGIGGKTKGEANARLIAAAPKLLKACKDGVKFLDSLLVGNKMTETQLRMLSENRMAFRKILEAAIAEAEQTGD